MAKKLIVIDYRVQDINIYDYDERKCEDPEDFQDEKGTYVLNNDCAYMVAKKVKINYHNKKDKVIGYYIFGTEEVENFEQTGEAQEHCFEVREFNTLEERNCFEAGIEAALGWNAVHRTNPTESKIIKGVLTTKK